MPPPRARWADLTVGVLALAALVLGAVAVLRYGQVGALRGDTVRIYALTGLARSIFPDSDVWLEGRRIGRVVDVDFRPVGTDTTERLLLELQVYEKYLPLLRRDSWAQIRPGGTLIGTPVVWLRAGTAAQAALRDGDTLAMRPQGDTEDVMSRVAVAAEALPTILANARTIASALDSSRGTVGAVLNEPSGARELGVVRGRAAGLVARATTGDGTTGRFLRNGRRDLFGRARAAMAEADTLRALLASPETSLGRYRRDSTLARTIADLRDEVSIVRTLMSDPRGTLGRVQADSAIAIQIDALARELDRLVQDVKAHPLRYLSVTP